MKRPTLLAALFSLSLSTAFSQKLEEVGAGVINFLLRNPKTANKMKTEEKIALDIISDLLKTEGQRKHELEYAASGRSQITINSGDGRQAKFVRNQNGDIYLLIDNIIYPIAAEFVNEAAGNESRFVFADSDLHSSGVLTLVRNDAIYDTYYKEPPHWKITDMGGAVSLRFPGQYTFYFRALGSTIDGKSFCFIDIYVNGVKWSSNKFVNENWTVYSIPPAAFSSGYNEVSIVLTGRTHIWLNEVWIIR